MVFIVVELMRANQESARKSQMVSAAKARKKQRLFAGQHGDLHSADASVDQVERRY